MREISIEEEQKITVRGLTRKELRELKKDGVDLTEMVIGKSVEVYDAVFKKVLPQEEIDLLEDKENKWSVAVFRGIMKETFGAPDEEKNS